MTQLTSTHIFLVVSITLISVCADANSQTLIFENPPVPEGMFNEVDVSIESGSLGQATAVIVQSDPALDIAVVKNNQDVQSQKDFSNISYQPVDASLQPRVVEGAFDSVVATESSSSNGSGFIVNGGSSNGYIPQTVRSLGEPFLSDSNQANPGERVFNPDNSILNSDTTLGGVEIESFNPNDVGYLGPGDMRTHLWNGHAQDLIANGITENKLMSLPMGEVQKWHNYFHGTEGAPDHDHAEEDSVFPTNPVPVAQAVDMGMQDGIVIESGIILPGTVMPFIEGQGETIILDNQNEFLPGAVIEYHIGQ